MLLSLLLLLKLLQLLQGLLHLHLHGEVLRWSLLLELHWRLRVRLRLELTKKRARLHHGLVRIGLVLVVLLLARVLLQHGRLDR